MSTCSFMDGGTSVVVFCENGCCDGDCCKDAVDFIALYVALAVIIAFLLLLVIIALIIYCCVRRKKRRKGEWRENLIGNRNDVVPLTMIHANSSNSDNNSHQRSSISTSTSSSGSSDKDDLHNKNLHGTNNGSNGMNRLIQTGNPNPEVKDKILGGRSIRWNPYNPHRKPVPPRSHRLKPSDRASQATLNADPYSLTPTPRTTNASRMSKDKNRGDMPSNGDNRNSQRKRMWLPAPKHNTLAPRVPTGQKSGQKPLPHEAHTHPNHPN